MTEGLLTSRKNKNTLHKKMISDPTVANINAYKTYRNVYNKILRAGKKLFYEKSLNEAKRNPKKTWEILNDITGNKKVHNDIDEIKIGNTVTSDKKAMANGFNKFFTSIGKEIAESVKDTAKQAEDFLDLNADVPNLNFANINPVYICHC